MRIRMVKTISWLILALLVVLTPNFVFAASDVSLKIHSSTIYQQAGENTGPISEVTFSGDPKDKLGFLQGETVHIEVKNPAGESIICDTKVDPSGSWSCTVKLWKTTPVFGTYYYRVRGLTSGVSFTGSFNNEGTVQGIELRMDKIPVTENGVVFSDSVLDAVIVASSDKLDFIWSSTEYQLQKRVCSSGASCKWESVSASACLSQPTPDLKGEFSEKEVVFQDVLEETQNGDIYRLLFTTYSDSKCNKTNNSQWYYTEQFTVEANPTVTTVTCVQTDDQTGKTMTCEAEVKRTVHSKGSPSGLVRFLVEGSENAIQHPFSCDLSGSADGVSVCQTTFRSENSGTYNLQAEYVSDSELDLGSTSKWLPVTFLIKKPVLNVIADPQIKTYGQSDPVLTYSYDPSDTFVSFSGMLEREQGEDAGVYAINQGTLSVEGYDIKFNPATFTIEKARAFIQAAGYSGVYDGQAHGVAGRATGVMGEDLGGLLSFGPTFTEVPGGLSSWSFSGNTNYLADEENEVPVTIFPREIEVTANALSKDYGDSDPLLSYSVSGGSLVNDDTFSGNLSREPGENAGLFFLERGTLTVNPNYNLTFVSAWFRINRRPITVAADPQKKLAGEADPVLTYRIQHGSLIGNDMFGGSIARSPGEAPGAYGINQSSLYLSDNYELSFIPSTFAIYITSDQLDEDFDGVLNAEDNCVFKSNIDQEDSDADGFGDVCDPTDNRLLASMIVPVTGSSGLSDTNCSGETVLSLENGDRVTLPSDLCGWKVSLSREPQASLPAELPEGFEFISAMNSTLLQGDNPQSSLPDGANLDFNLLIPAKNSDDKALIFYWDEHRNDGGGGWVNIPSCLGLEPLAVDSRNNEKYREITKCVTLQSPSNLEFSTNFPGLFVLVILK